MLQLPADSSISLDLVRVKEKETLLPILLGYNPRSPLPETFSNISASLNQFAHGL